jgi:hypothetical protein
MAAKYESVFYSEKGVKYVVEIHDTTYFGSEKTAFDCLGIQIRYDTNGEEDNRFTPVIQSEAGVDMFINSSDLNSFVEDLVSSYENKYYLYITTEKQTGQPYTFRWAGYILTDLVTIEDVDLNLGYSFTVKAKDGLNTLKNIDYSNNGVPYTGKATLFQHLYNVFYKLGFILYSYFTFDEYLFASAINWHAGEYTYSGANTPLLKARIAHRAFYHRDTKGNYIYKNCFEVLTEICKALGCRIILSGSGYHLVQINEYLNANSLYEYKYNLLTGGFSGGAVDYTINHDQADIPNTDIYRLNGGSFEFFSPLQYTRVEYEHLATRNLLAGAVWNVFDQTAKVAEDIESNNLESVLQLDFGVSYRTNFFNVTTDNLRVNHYVVMRMEIKLQGVSGASYYQNTFTRQPSKNDVSQGRWLEDQGYFYYILPLVTNENNNQTNIQLIIENIPIYGDLSVTHEFYNLYDAFDDQPLESVLFGQSPTGIFDYYVINYEASGTFMQYISTGFLSDQNDIIRFEANNDNVGYKTSLTETLIGDGPNVNSPGHLEVRDDANEWVLSEIGWTVGNTGDAKNISQLLANEQIKGQLLPVKKFAQTTFVMNDPTSAFLQPHYAINYDGAYWVFHGGIYDLYRDMVTGTWWKIKIDN